jgi:hypothetical protein
MPPAERAISRAEAVPGSAAEAAGNVAAGGVAGAVSVYGGGVDASGGGGGLFAGGGAGIGGGGGGFGEPAGPAGSVTVEPGPGPGPAPSLIGEVAAELTVQAGARLSVPADHTLTLDGGPDRNEGAIEVAGALAGRGHLDNGGSIAVSGSGWSVAGYEGPGGAPAASRSPATPSN